MIDLDAGCENQAEKIQVLLLSSILESNTIKTESFIVGVENLLIKHFENIYGAKTIAEFSKLVVNLPFA